MTCGTCRCLDAPVVDGVCVADDFSSLLIIQLLGQIDSAGRCCGRKPIAYRRPPRLFCSRCDREFDLVTGKQVPNFHWVQRGDGFRLSDTAIGAAVASATWEALNLPTGQGGNVARDAAEGFIRTAYIDGRLT